MIRVYIWDTDLHTGHAALSTEHYYRSFHPRYRDHFLVADRGYPPEWVDNANDDIEIKNDRFSEYIDIHGGHEGDLNDYIQYYLEEDFPEYHLHTSNCSTVVATMLMVAYHGHLHHHGDFDEILWKLRSGHILFHHDHESRNSRYFEEAFDRFEDTATRFARAGKLTPMAFAIGLVEVWRRAVIWTPGDISRMAHQMKNLIEQHG